MTVAVGSIPEASQASVSLQSNALSALARQGIFLATNPHSSFFYLLTGIHGLHLLVGLIWFSVVLARVRRLAYTPGEDGLGSFAAATVSPCPFAPGTSGQIAQ